MRLLLIGLALTVLSGCVTAGDHGAALDPVPAQIVAGNGKATLASTMEVRVDTSAVGGISPTRVGKKLALALATITEYRPDTGTAVTPIQSAVALPDASGQMTRTTVYNPNAYRQTVWMDDHDKVLFDRRDVEPGWYLVHSFGSTAGFARDKPRTGQRGCLQYGGAPATGVSPVALRAGEVGYFGHFVITIAVEPSRDLDAPYTLSVADAAIEPAPPGLDDILRHDGIDPARVTRISSERFPCPWTVPRLAAN